MNHVMIGVLARPSVPVGRDEDVRRIRALLRDGARLITLRGPGGIGKTALATHLVHTLVDEYTHVLFVDLTPERDPGKVLDAIAAHLPSTDEHLDAFHRLVAFAAGRRVLLVLDNFEQVVDAAPDLVGLIDRTTLQVLVTSRVALHVHAEHEVEVAPLTIPRHAVDGFAVQLFVQRARQVKTVFELDDATRPLVTEIVTRLEGVPLAIELAASRLRTFRLADLLARLDRPLQVLKADFRDRPERLRSLRAAVQWSYDLLSDEDREVFECCAVFEGSFTPEALVAVWGGEEVLDRVEHLLEQSFLQHVEAAVTRWKMLQPLRELALEHLEHHPQAEVWRERHSWSFLHVLEDMRQGRPGPHPKHREVYLPDYPNMRAGLVWAIQRRRAEVALRYLDGIFSFWVTSGMRAEGRALTEAALSLDSTGFERFRLRGLLIQTDHLYVLGDLPGMEACVREHRALSETHGTEEDRAWSNCLLAIALHSMGNHAEALEIAQRVIDWFEGRGPSWSPGPNAWMVYAVATVNSVFPLLATGQYEPALERARQGVERLERAGNTRATTQRTVIGTALLHLGRFGEAAQEYRASLGHMIEHGHVASTGLAAWGFMHVAAERRPDLAVSFAAFAKRETKGRTDAHVDRWHLRRLEGLRATLSAEDFERAWKAGERWTPEEVLRHADAFIAENGQAPARVGRAPQPHVETHGLTAREEQVLKLVAAGHPDRRIAKLLEISPATASKHVSNILSKLGLRNRTELAGWAAQHQLRE